MDQTATTLPSRHKLDVYDFYRMGETGILAEQDRVELIDGALIDMPPIGDNHAGTVNQLNELLGAVCFRRAIVSIQNPVRLDRYNEPQPDIAICRRRADFYRSEHPKPADVILLVEVSDISLRYDQTVKLDLYARAGIAEYWIVDLQNKSLIVHRQPSAVSFEEIRTMTVATRLALVASPDIVIDLAGLFGPLVGE